MQLPAVRLFLMKISDVLLSLHLPAGNVDCDDAHDTVLNVGAAVAAVAAAEDKGEVGGDGDVFIASCSMLQDTRQAC